MLKEYAYPSAKVGGMKSYLLDPFELKAIMETGSFEDALSLLKNTAYGKELAKLQSSAPKEIERVLVKSLLRDMDRLSKALDGSRKAFLEVYAKRFEVEALKAVLILKITKTKVAHPWIPYGAMGEAAIERLLQAETLEELFELLKATEYYEVLHRALSESKERSSPFPYLVALDRYHYGRVWAALGGLKGRDRTVAEGLIGPEIDLKNLTTVLRLRGGEEKAVWPCLLPCSYQLDEEALRLIFNIGRLGEIFAQLPALKYRELLVEGVKEYERSGSTALIEREFRMHLLATNQRVFRGDRFHIGAILGYLNLKENEVRNITAIVRG
ncbi:MAG TPA: V-type ATPase subunit, partial [Dehalococcoidia bacterium]|nr:V-type ATPase subunit [Dehalococcoidia bacterium]